MQNDMNRSTPALWSFASKSACGLTAALVMLGVSTAQVAPPGGGGGTGGGTGGSTGGGGGSVISNSQWQITTTSQCYSATAWLTPQGSGSNTQATPNLGRSTATVDGVLGSISAKCGGTYTHTIKWIGVGAPPPYAFAVLTSVGGYSDYDGGSGLIELGLPMVVGNDPSKQYGRKIAKLKLNKKGEATFTVTGSATATANSTYDLGLYSSCDGIFSSAVGLDLKALGLQYDGTKMRSGSPTGAGYPVDASSGDFERETIAVGVLFDSLTLTGTSSQDLLVRRIVNWQNPANTTFEVHANPTGTCQKVYGFDPDLVTAVRIGNSFNEAKLGTMFKGGPEVTTVKAKQSDVGSDNPGPFAGEMTILYHAPSELLEAYNFENNSGYLPWIEKNAQGIAARVFVDLLTVGATANLTANIGNSIVNPFPVTITGGISIPFIWEKTSVKLDIQRNVGQQMGTTSQTGVSYPAGPCKNPKEEWSLFCNTRTHHRKRFLAVYNTNGYTNDDTDQIDNTDPAELHFVALCTSEGGSM